MTPKEAEQHATNLLAQWQDDGKTPYDVETAHRQADDILVKFIRTLGYNQIADLFENIPKWYA